MKRKNHRAAFSMVTSLIVIVLMSTVAIYVLSTSAKMVKETTAQYQREQAMLLAKSYTEYAIMAVTANDRNNTSTNYCLEDIEGQAGGDPDKGEGYKIETRIAYIGNSIISQCAATRQLGSITEATRSPLNVIVDVYVRYKDPDHPDASAAPYITYHKRTLQKI
jgi:type II secretory pathway pseudopilin PulG